MRNFRLTLLSAGIALASLASCSRANYAFNPTTPAYQEAQPVQRQTASVAEPTTAAPVAAAPVAAAPVAEPILITTTIGRPKPGWRRLPWLSR